MFLQHVMHLLGTLPCLVMSSSWSLECCLFGPRVKLLRLLVLEQQQPHGNSTRFRYTTNPSAIQQGCFLYCFWPIPLTHHHHHCHQPCRLKNHYKLNHPHVVKMKDVFVTPHHLNIVLDLAEGGMLLEHVNKCLRQNGGQMKEDDARWDIMSCCI